MTVKKTWGARLVDLIVAFDRHCLCYFALAGFLAGWIACIANKRATADAPWTCAAAAWVVGGLAWYTLKSIFITAETCLTWKTRYPGVPFIRSGTLTQYDTDQARIIGEEVARGIQNSQNQHKCNCCKGGNNDER